MNFDYDFHSEEILDLVDVFEFIIPQNNLLCWMLELDVDKSTGKLAQIQIYSDSTLVFTQYLERNCHGKRLINLTGINAGQEVRIRTRNCQVKKSGVLLGFKQPRLDGEVLIIAPHPDDAELAAYGFYAKRADKTWICTVTAGELCKKIKKQYWKNLDDTAEEATLRKGKTRAWNSVTTPMLAGVSSGRCVVLGYPDGGLDYALGNQCQPIRNNPGVDSPKSFRCFNEISLVTDNNNEFTGADLINDLVELIDKIKPQTILVTHPEVDPHKDHQACAEACFKAIETASHKPENIMLYANHLCPEGKGFPWGPAHSAAGVWPWAGGQSRFSKYGLYSEYLDLDLQKDKVVALDTMHDLRDQPRLRKSVKLFMQRLTSGVRPSAWPVYARHDYFQTAIKCHEVFICLK